MSFSEYMVVKHEVYPIKDLKRQVTEAIFFQDNAEDVYARLKGLESKVVQYWEKVPKEALSNYMEAGSIPFATCLPDQRQALDAIYRTIRAIVESDLPQISQFKKETAPFIIHILSILAISSGISTNKLSTNIGIDYATVSEILATLVKAEVVIEVKPYGSIKNSAKKPKKYLFMSPALRSSILFAIGGSTLLKRHRGERFEDVIGMYLYREIAAKHRGAISYFEKGKKLHVDFIVSIAEKKIPLEVGAGTKDTKQLWDTMEKINAAYGIICHSGELSIHDDKVIRIPHKFFLLV